LLSEDGELLAMNHLEPNSNISNVLSNAGSAKIVSFLVQAVEASFFKSWSAGLKHLFGLASEIDLFELVHLINLCIREVEST